MNDTDRELLSAFFDGEPVDAAALAAALENEAAIETLRGFARLHAEVASSGLAPRPGWVQATRAKLVDLDGGSWWARWVAVAAPPLGAAAVADRAGTGDREAPHGDAHDRVRARERLEIGIDDPLGRGGSS